MSGGSYDYVYGRIDDIELRNRETDPRRAAFQKLLKLVARAMHDIEWVDSCDYGPGDDHQAIDAVFSFLGADAVTIAKARAYDDLAGTLKNFFELQEARRKGKG
jgi:hypothetical protein